MYKKHTQLHNNKLWTNHNRQQHQRFKTKRITKSLNYEALLEIIMANGEINFNSTYVYYIDKYGDENKFLNDVTIDSLYVSI